MLGVGLRCFRLRDPLDLFGAEITRASPTLTKVAVSMIQAGLPVIQILAMIKQTKHYEYFLIIRDLKWFFSLSEAHKPLLSEFLHNLDPAVYYMLEGRFAKSTKKIERRFKGLNLTPDITKLLESQRLATGKRDKLPRLEPTDVIKAFKLLESQLLHGKAPEKARFEELSLGSYRESLVKSSDSITTLLLCIPSIDRVQARIILSVMHSAICIYRQFKVKAKADISTITGRFNGSKPLELTIEKHFTDEKIDKFIHKYLNVEKLNKFNELFIYSGNASSPNSGHSSVNYLADVAALYNDSSLLRSVLSLALCFKNGTALKNIVDILVANVAWDKEYLSGKVHSRTVTFTAPGGKARIIVVADWITQTALSAIHKTQFQFLQLIPSDRTFNHKSGLDIYESDADNYVSVDLSAATDRLPRVLQARLINRLFHSLGMNGDVIAKHWLSVVDRSYLTKNSLLEHTAPEVRYEVGQGMGLFSSWSSMAILHHYIVSEICGCKVENYSLVGDDLLMKNSIQEYARYTEFMAEIGVTVNQNKTLVSTEAPHTVEFARNYIISGHKIDDMPTGVVYAYYDGKLSRNEVFYNFADTFYFVSPRRLIDYLQIADRTEMHILAYFLWREKIMTDYGVLRDFLASKGHALNITASQFHDINEICNVSRDPPYKRKQIDFIESLLSQCTMRREEDLNKIVSLGDDFAALRFSGDEIVDYAEVMRERILNAQPIVYLPGLGNPTTTKREARLIMDFLTYLDLVEKEKLTEQIE